MKLNSFFQRGAVLTLMLVEMIAAPILIHGQTGPVDRYSASTVNLSNSGDSVRIDVLKWSTEAERTQLLAALAKGDKDFVTALGAMPTQGYIWTAETAGYLVKYAFKTSMPDGTERIIIATERRLGSFDPKTWKPAGNVPATDYPFSVLELRIDSKKVGQGKGSVTAKVIADNEAKTLSLENFTAAPQILKDVKRIGGAS